MKNALRIIYGRAGSGKTRKVLEEIKQRVDGGARHPLVLLVPEQFSFQAEKDLIKMLGSGGIMQTEVLSFRRLAFRVFNAGGGITYPHLHAAGKCMIIYRLLDKAREQLKVFARSADRPGFVNVVSDLITEFKRYNVGPDDLAEVLSSYDQEHPLKDKLTELNSIYASYEEAIATRYRDADDDLTLAARKLNGLELYCGAEIWLDGFASFTPQEYEIIAELLKSAARVNVTLCVDRLDGFGEEGDLFASVRGTIRKLQAIANEQGIAIEDPLALRPQVLPRFAESTELRYLEQNYFAYPYKPYAGVTKNISLFCSVNMYSEIEETAREIVRLCREEGLRFREIAVILRDLSSYERLIEVIFAEHDIPCFLDRKIDINTHPLVRMLTAMLEIFSENWSYESLFRYLKTGLTGTSRADIDKLENYVLACGIRGVRWTNPEPWAMTPGFLPEDGDAEKYNEELLEINRIRFQIAAPLLEFRAKTKGRRTAREFCSALYDFLLTLNVPSTLEQSIEQFRNNGQLAAANEYSQVWSTVMDVFDQAVEVMGEEKMGVERFSDILEIGLREYQIGLIPPTLDQVLIASVDRAKSLEVEGLFVLGVNDGVFPASASTEGILSDRDRAALNASGITLANDTRAKAFEEQYLVYRALAASKRYLRLSWPIADHEGRTLRPSNIIARLRKLFPEISAESNITREESDEAQSARVSAPAPTFKQLIGELRRKGNGEEVSALWGGVYSWFEGQIQWIEKCAAIRAAFQHKNLAQPLSMENAKGLYGEPAYASVSRLEKFNSCPFSYYVQYGLGAKERKIYRLSPPDVGTFMHAVIERFSFLLVEQSLSWREITQEWCQEQVSEIVDEMLLKMRGSGISGSKRYTALTLRLKRVISRSVWLIAEHIRRSSFDPIGYELEFGSKGDFPAIEIETESGQKVLLSGRIDRVDAMRTEDGTYLRVIDYKSGSKDFKLSDVYYGLQVQLITYLDALWQGGGKGLEPPILPGGILYFRLDDPLVRGGVNSQEADIERDIMRQLKMKGLLLADVKLIKAMDHGISGPSEILPARLNKDGELGNSSVASLQQLNTMRAHVRRLLTKLCSEIMCGNAAIQPYKKQNTTSCAYCNFSSICQFDPARPENSFKPLYDLKDDVVWGLVAEDKVDGI